MLVLTPHIILYIHTFDTPEVVPTVQVYNTSSYDPEDSLYMFRYNRVYAPPNSNGTIKV